MLKTNEDGKKEFMEGKENQTEAEKTAKYCDYFKLDVEAG